MQINEPVRNEKYRSEAFFLVEHRHNNPIASLDYARVNKSILYLTMHKQKAPINMLVCSKTQHVEGFTHKEITSDILGRR